MIENMPLRIGQKVPSFEIEIYDPGKSDFGNFIFNNAKADKKWTILFFYPADFTFV
jgi:NADH-dependent peroxiredoxin subunit C